MDDGLIFDVGMHRGEDTAFYLEKGFRVVGIEADPDLANLAADRFEGEIGARRLTVVNHAISDTPGPVTLYKNTSLSVWNTLKPEWARRNRDRGTDSVAVQVEAVTLSALLERYGVPYYLKIDIEGMDLVALQSIASQPGRPRYVSIESDMVSFTALRQEFAVFNDLGYDRFKLVPQHLVKRQRPPNPPREGRFVDHVFEPESSGLFGEETPGTKWLTTDEAVEAYRSVFLRYALTGHESFVRNRFARAILKRLGFRSGWYDTHARLTE